MPEEYSREERLRKLQKLRDLADHPATEGPLAEAAREQYEKLLRKWEVDPASLETEQPREWTFKMPPGCEIIFSQAVHHLELKGWKPKKFRITILATQAEKDLYYTLVSLALAARRQKIAEQKKALHSFLLGLAVNSFPTGPSKCPKCGEPHENQGGRYSFDDEARRFTCASCGYKGRKFPAMDIDQGELAEGAAAADRLRPGRLITRGRK